MSPDMSWKQEERAVARLLGTTREHFEAIDVTHPILHVEVKHRRRITYEEIVAWLAETEAKTPTHKVGVVVVRKRKGRGVKTPRLWVFSDQGIRDLFGVEKSMRQGEILRVEAEAAGKSASAPVPGHWVVETQDHR